MRGSALKGFSQLILSLWLSAGSVFAQTTPDQEFKAGEFFRLPESAVEFRIDTQGAHAKNPELVARGKYGTVAVTSDYFDGKPPSNAEISSKDHDSSLYARKRLVEFEKSRQALWQFTWPARLPEQVEPRLNWMKFLVEGVEKELFERLRVPPQEFKLRISGDGDVKIRMGDHGPEFSLPAKLSDVPRPPVHEQRVLGPSGNWIGYVLIGQVPNTDRIIEALKPEMRSWAYLGDFDLLNEQILRVKERLSNRLLKGVTESQEEILQGMIAKLDEAIVHRGANEKDVNPLKRGLAKVIRGREVGGADLEARWRANYRTWQEFTEAVDRWAPKLGVDSDAILGSAQRNRTNVALIEASTASQKSFIDQLSQEMLVEDESEALHKLQEKGGRLSLEVSVKETIPFHPPVPGEQRVKFHFTVKSAADGSELAHFDHVAEHVAREPLPLDDTRFGHTEAWKKLLHREVPRGVVQWSSRPEGCGLVEALQKNIQ